MFKAYKVPHSLQSIIRVSGVQPVRNGSCPLSLIAFYCEIIFRAKEVLFLGYAIKKTRLPFH